MGISDDQSKPERPKEEEVSPDNFLDTDFKARFLVTEYIEAGNEARSRDRLIHNSFYLFFFLLAALPITAFQFKQNLMVLSILSLIAFFSFAFLAVVIYTYTTYRSSAWSRRRRLEEKVEARTPELLRIQRDVVNRRLPVQGEPRELNRFEGLPTQWVSIVVFIVSIISLLVFLISSYFWLFV